MEAGEKRTILLTMRSHYFSPKEKCRRESKSQKSKTEARRRGASRSFRSPEQGQECTLWSSSSNRQRLSGPGRSRWKGWVSLDEWLLGKSWMSLDSKTSVVCKTAEGRREREARDRRGSIDPPLNAMSRS